MRIIGGAACFSRGLMLAALAVAVSSCTTTTEGGVTHHSLDILKLGYESVATFDTPVGLGQLRKGRGDGAYMVTLGTGAPQEIYNIPGRQNSNLSLLYSQRFGASQAVVFGSSTPGCPYDYILMIVDPTHHLLTNIGNCRSQLTFETADQQFLAHQIQGGADPLYWVYSSQSYKEYGPIKMSVLYPAPKPISPSPPLPAVQMAPPARKPSKPTVAANPQPSQQANSNSTSTDDKAEPTAVAKHQMLQPVGAAAISTSALESSGTGKQMNSLTLMDKPASGSPTP